MKIRTSIFLTFAAFASTAQGAVLIANRFENNVIQSDATGLGGWTAFASFGSNVRNVASDGSNVFIGTADNAVYSYNSGGSQTGTNNPGNGAFGRLTYVTGTTNFNGLVQAGSDNNVRNFGTSGVVGAPVSTTSISWSPGAAPVTQTVGESDYLYTPGGGNSVRRNVLTTIPTNNSSFTLTGQGSAFSQAHMALAPNGDQFFGGHFAAGTGARGGIYISSADFSAGATYDGSLADQRIVFADAGPQPNDPGNGGIRDMGFDPYTATATGAEFYVLGNANRLFKYDYDYATQSFNFVGSSVGGAGSLAINQGLQLAFIPEPSAALLGGIGMLALLRRRRNND